MIQGKLDHTKHWSDLFIGRILILMHVGPMIFLAQYIKTTGRKNVFSLSYLLCVSCPAVREEGGMAVEKV